MLNMTKTKNSKMVNPPKGLVAIPEINNLTQDQHINPVHAANLAKNHKKVLLGRFPTLATKQIELLLDEDCTPVYMDFHS